MPKCYLNAIRGYRTGKYKGNNDHDPHVMTTRSGLSIRKINATKGGIGSTVKSSLPLQRQRRENNTATKKYPIVKYKSLSYLSFVTRFILALRVPELELAGVNPKEALEYVGDSGYFYRYESTSSSYSGCDSYDDISESEIEEEVFEGVDDNVLFDFDCENDNNSEKGKDDLCESVSEICLNDNQNSDTTNDKKNIDTSSSRNDSKNIEIKVLGVRFAGNGGQSETDSERPVMNSLILQLKNETQLPFKCQECEKGFTLFSAYTAHVRSHAKQRNRCGVCGKIFTRSWLLKGHMRTHTGERPFPCQVEGCDKAFADKSNLRSHMLIHSVTSKNFTCEKCGRAFAQKRYLHKHMLEVCRLI